MAAHAQLVRDLCELECVRALARLHARTREVLLATRIWFHLLAASSRKNGMEFHIAFGKLGLSFWVDVAHYVCRRAFFESREGVGDLQSAQIFPNCPTDGGYEHHVIARVRTSIARRCEA